MEVLWQLIYKNLIAGVVALLPVGGTILGIVWLEFTIAESWLAQQPFYFPGLGLLAVIVVIYVVGLVVSTFLGRWAWSLVDDVLKHLPLLGSLYATLKQILGYGEGDEAIFEKAVFVRSRENDAEELGLITNRLLVLDESEIRPLGMKVNDALTALVSVGKSGLDLSPHAGPTK